MLDKPLCLWLTAIVGICFMAAIGMSATLPASRFVG